MPASLLIKGATIYDGTGAPGVRGDVTVVRGRIEAVGPRLEQPSRGRTVEADGLAMSSRNIYLTAEERRAAPVLYRALRTAAERARSGETDPARLASLARETIGREPLARIDYVETVDGETLETVTMVRPGLLLAAAVWFGRARLIDNVIL